MSTAVSIVITCYNFRRYIAAALQSVAQQTHREFEAIVVDNNSTDGSTDIIEAFAHSDRRFTLLREPQQGVHHALNAGLRRATGDLVLLLDGDDLYRPDRLARTLAVFEATAGDLVACNGQRMDGTGVLGDFFEPYFHSACLTPLVVCQYNPIWTVSFLALSRRAVETLGALPESSSRILDWHLLMRAYESELAISFLDEDLVLKRYDGRNLALDVETTECQAIPRLHRFMATHPGLRSLLTPEDRGRLLTVRYVRAFEHMRRNGRWSALPDYLADYVGPDAIRDVVQRFVRAVAWYHLDRRRFLTDIESYDCGHPLWLFIRGLAQVERGRYEDAVRLFELAYVKPMRRFREALNSWAIAMAHVDRARAVSLLEHLVQCSPDYQDARLNLSHLRRDQVEHCRHTVCLRPDTLHWLADWT